MTLLVSGTGSEPFNMSSMPCLPYRVDVQACGWWIGAWEGCAAYLVTGVLLSSPGVSSRIWELTPKVLEPASLFLPPFQPRYLRVCQVWL